MAMTDDGATKVPAAQLRPTITLPPRSSVETLFSGGGGFSPGPMTLVSSYFSDNYPGSDCRSFSQLLSGAMASPSPKFPIFLADNSSKEGGSGDGGDRDLGFRQNRPLSLVVAHSPMFMIPSGLSPSGLLNSPGFFSPLQSPFGMTHQQALAQVTAQAALSQSYMHIQDECQPSAVTVSAESLTHHQPSASNTTMAQQICPVKSEPENSRMESSEASQSERKSLPPSGTVDKPGNDGYNWRKYGQKQVKASEYPRSYYRCTHLNCPVKKKVERNLDGQIVEIIYKGQHNHELPHSNKRAKDSIDVNPIMDSQAGAELSLHGETEMNRSNETSHSHLERDRPCTQLIPIQLPGSSDFSEIGDVEAKPDESNDDEPNSKRRNTEVGKSEPTSSQRTVTEPRIVVQTRSEVDLLDDGYKWRKYGQKVVKGNLHPRSYYKCTTVGCNVRKHVERASTDPKAVVTTYEGKHNHDIPAARRSSHSTANNSTLQLKAQKIVAKKPAALIEVEGMDFGNTDQRPALLQLKEEQIRA